MGRGKGVRPMPSGEKVNSSGYSLGAGKFQRSEQWCMRSGSHERRSPGPSKGHGSPQCMRWETGHRHPVEFSFACCSLKARS